MPYEHEINPELLSSPEVEDALTRAQRLQDQYLERWPQPVHVDDEWVEVLLQQMFPK